MHRIDSLSYPDTTLGIPQSAFGLAAAQFGLPSGEQLLLDQSALWPCSNSVDTSAALHRSLSVLVSARLKGLGLEFRNSFGK